MRESFSKTSFSREMIGLDERKKIFHLYKNEHLSSIKIGKLLGRDRNVIYQVIKRGEDYETKLQKLIKLSEKAVGIIKTKGPIAKKALSKEMGININYLLITITDFFPEIAEEDDGKLFYIWGRGHNG